jgi:hypothetical protein
MAKDKRSFILYSDIHHTVKKLTDDQAGKLFKVILSYVNDENPVIKDVLLDLVFEPIKQSLKRDLKRYKDIVDKRIEAGKIGGVKSGEKRRKKIEAKEAKEASALKAKQTKQGLGNKEGVNALKNEANKANEAVNDNGSVNVSDNDKEKNIIPPPVFLIAKYCKERNNGIDANYFFDWYQTRGWKVGKDKMKDWQSAIRTWEKRQTPKPETKLMMP